MESIIEEAERLIDAGAKELNLISQDTTSYGKDIYGGPVLNKLLRRLVKIDGIRWIRLLYTHPAHFTDELIETIASEPAICKYIDLPLQHINDDILARMGRKVTKDSILSLLKNLRERIEGLVLRTSFIVGFPGETEEAFKELLGFIEEIRFERLGVFAYSKEEGTLAYGFDSHIQEKTKHNRLKAVMELQRSISGQYNQSLLGKRFTVLVDEVDENDPHLYIARTYGDAPEVDGEVLVRSRRVCSKGEFLDVRVIDTYEYDLVAEAVHEFA
jgi:ribosomal protein S12 methylthiotransferase